MAGAFAKTKKATNILRPAIDATFDKDAESESEVFSEVGVYIAGPGMIPPHVDTILVKNFYEFFSENLGIDSTRDRYM